ncbi:RNA polymerase sigma factor [Lutibacter sp. HS1-25]|uniref:RNA polymerase sigma factor n=1 Tax=Lutibacter sp. HS1-25 TaxID=2485000 RepID=UPI001F0C7648|nr:RNA polymerase sigma factor [Lutibacter sp. HS1-25]
METNLLIHKELVEKSKKGDRNAQFQLYKLYVNAMYNVCMRLVGSKEDAEDILQDSFVKAFKNLHSFRYESTFGSWLKKIVVNKSINFLKLKKIPITAIENHEYYLTNEPTQNFEEQDIKKIKKGIDLLPNGFKQIITLYLIEGYDHAEIGEILEITTSTSKSQYHRAKKKLIEIINTL